jgi:Flp pilus assembly protein TadG
VVEFLLLVLPLFGLSAATVGVTWFSFAKAQLEQITEEAALQLSEPDSTELEVLESATEKVKTRLGAAILSMNSTVISSTSSVTIELPAWQFLGPLSLVLPELSAGSNVPAER